jgi:phosphohistidine phosphatase
MQLYLVRHAEAAPGQPDDLRPLTPNGREQARLLGEHLRSKGVRADVILTSPLLRARETGALIARELGGADVEVAEELAPGATAEALSRALKEARAPSGGIAIAVAIGHQPDCGKIAAALTGKPEPAFPPATSFAIELEP